jgi:MFS family permease
MLLWSGQSISSIGSRVSGIVFPLLILDLTHSAAQAGLAGALQSVPYALFGLPGGALVDRWNRKRVMLLCDSARALNIISIPLALWLGHLSIAQILLVTFLEGSLYTFYDIAQQASLPRVVTAEQLPAGLTRSSALIGTAGLIGPPIGGVLYQIGRAIPFLADAVSYGFSVVTLLFIHTEFQAEHTGARRRLHREILEGLDWIRHQPLVRFTGLMAANNGMAFTGLALVIIILARQQHASAATIGFMFAIASIGGTAGSFIATPIVRRVGFAAILIGTCWIAVLLTPLFLVITAPLVLGVLTGILWMNSTPFHLTTYIHRRALLPDELQGRVGSVFELSELGADAAGAAIVGVLLQTIGTRSTLLILLGWLALQAVAVTSNRHVRHAPALLVT